MALTKKLTKKLLFLTVFGQNLVAMPPKEERLATFSSDRQTINYIETPPSSREEAIRRIDFWIIEINSKISEHVKYRNILQQFPTRGSQELVGDFNKTIELGNKILEKINEIKTNMTEASFLKDYKTILTLNSTFTARINQGVELYTSHRGKHAKNNPHGRDSLTQKKLDMRGRALDRAAEKKKVSSSGDT